MNLNPTKEFDPTVVRPQDALTVTEAAFQHITKALQKRGSGIGIRVSLEKKGCSGFAYVVDFVDSVNADDHVFPLANNLKIVVNPKFLPFLKGTEIDYVREGMNSRFKFNNPNEKGACGCGESFNLE